VHASKRDSSVKPDAGNPLVRFEEGGGGRLCLPLRYSTVLDRRVPARGPARNQRATAVGFTEESRFFREVELLMGEERTEADRCERVVPTQARDRACVVTRLRD
jgi:hypothetical protein